LGVRALFQLDVQVISIFSFNSTELSASDPSHALKEEKIMQIRTLGRAVRV